MTDPYQDIQILADLIREILCQTDEYERNGGREIPLLDRFSEIQEAIEDAVGIERDTLMHYTKIPYCGDEDCYGCNLPENTPGCSTPIPCPPFEEIRLGGNNENN